jgi:hypothetical protein
MKKKLIYLIALTTILFFKLSFNYDLLSSIAIGIFAYWISSLLIRANDSLPIKELFLSLYGFQYLFGAALAYNGLDEYNPIEYQMRVSSDTYFLYVIPIFLTFSLGYNIFAKKNTIKINRDNIDLWLNKHPQSPYIFIITGFVFSFLTDVFPSNFNFIIYILSGFKYIGLFILLMSYRSIKPFLMALIYGFILISSFKGGMFHDLLIWIIILALLLVYRYKPNWKLKLIGLLLFGIFAIFIQSIKIGLREETWFGKKDTSIDLVENVTKDVVSSNDGLLSMKNLGPNIIRINQGWVLASTMNTVPRIVKHTNGELVLNYVYSALVPRFFDSDKLKSGGHDLVNKYSAHDIGGDTSVALGLFSDVYIDFGAIGAVFCVFLFGLLYGYILNQFYVKSFNYPILILFSTLAFIYPIRPDTDTGSALGNLFKTIMLIWIIFSLYPSYFKIANKNKLNS